MGAQAARPRLADRVDPGPAAPRLRRRAGDPSLRRLAATGATGGRAGRTTGSVRPAGAGGGRRGPGGRGLPVLRVSDHRGAAEHDPGGGRPDSPSPARGLSPVATGGAPPAGGGATASAGAATPPG